jgi:hypothetical protein
MLRPSCPSSRMPTVDLPEACSSLKQATRRAILARRASTRVRNEGLPCHGHARMDTVKGKGAGESQSFILTVSCQPVLRGAMRQRCAAFQRSTLSRDIYRIRLRWLGRPCRRRRVPELKFVAKAVRRGGIIPSGEQAADGGRGARGVGKAEGRAAGYRLQAREKGDVSAFLSGIKHGQGWRRGGRIRQV